MKIVVIRAQAEFRDIGHYRSALIGCWQPAPALEGQLHLPDPLAQRNIQVCESWGVDAPVRITSMPPLKSLDAIHQCAVVSALIGRHSNIPGHVAEQL